MRRRLPAIPLAAAFLAAAGAGAPPASDAEPAPDTAPPRLSESPPAERQTLGVLMSAPSWTKRAIAALRLERYAGDDEGRVLLRRLLSDEAWQVRVFAVRSLGRQRVAGDLSWFAAEEDPRVLRAALRFRYSVDVERLGRGVRVLTRSSAIEDRMLAAELGAASGDPTLSDLAEDTTRKIIMRMTRTEAGALSPRLAVLTGQRDMRRPYRWRQWLRKAGRSLDLHGGHLVDDAGTPAPLSRIGRLDPERFAALEEYIQILGERKVDLAICLDCTASMYGELAAAQGGADDLMLFVGDVVGSLRVAVVGYRDRREKFETRGWDFTEDIEVARGRLWQLTAEGGGDTRELVHTALRFAYTQLTWMPEHSKVLVLIGDAPPHVGFGGQCVDMARRAAANELTTHVIQTEGRDVDFFPEISDAGGGRCVSLEDDDALIAEIAGLTLGDAFEEEFQELFEIYLRLCR